MPAHLELTANIEIPIQCRVSSDGKDPVKQSFSAQVAPFNSGEWTFFHYGYFGCTYGIEWSGVDTSTAVECFTLTVMSGSSVIRTFKTDGRNEFKGYGRVQDVFSWNSGAIEPSLLRIEWTTRDASAAQVQMLKQINTEVVSKPFPNDVRLYFPLDGGRSLELWASRKILSAASAYFKSAFELDLEEFKDTVLAHTVVDTKVRDAPDSESEWNDSPDDDGPPCIPAELPEFECYNLKIEKTSYQTYRSVLCWIYTSHVDFAPLLSTFATDSIDARAARDSYLSAFALKNPTIPVPSSPSSIYRLAHYLEIPVLQRLALANLRAQLTPANIAIELFSETSGRYPDALELLSTYAAKHKREMKESEGWKATMAKIGEIEWSGVVFAKLAEKAL
ncbi:hypothetical protein RQP46_004546 [Phenoliferia psychrophenolica]